MSNGWGCDLFSDASDDGSKMKDVRVRFKEVDYIQYMLRRRIELWECGEEMDEIRGSGFIGWDGVSSVFSLVVKKCCGRVGG